MEDSCQTLRYLTIGEILWVAKKWVCGYKLRDKERLDYLVEAVGGTWGDIELYPTLAKKAAVYAHHIITGHIFMNGNKRIGITCALWFLVKNGCTLRLSIDDSIVWLGYRIADRTITDLDIIADRIKSWIRSPTGEDDANDSD
jgi:death-on-curing protein